MNVNTTSTNFYKKLSTSTMGLFFKDIPVLSNDENVESFEEAVAAFESITGVSHFKI